MTVFHKRFGRGGTVLIENGRITVRFDEPFGEKKLSIPMRLRLFYVTKIIKNKKRFLLRYTSSGKPKLWHVPNG